MWVFIIRQQLRPHQVVFAPLVYEVNSPIYYSRAEKTSKGAILDFFWMALGNSTDN